MGVGVHPQLPVLQQPGSGGGSAPAQYRPDAGDHLHHPEGLGEIIVRPGVQTHHLVVLRPLGGSHDDGNPGGGRVGSQGFQDSDAVLVGQHDVQQNQLRLGAAQAVEQPRTVPEALRLKARRPQGVQHQLPDAVIVLYTVNHLVFPQNAESFSFHGTIAP